MSYGSVRIIRRLRTLVGETGAALQLSNILRMSTAAIVFVLSASCATTVDESDAFAMDVRSNRLFIPVEINGAPTEALLDSGAEMTLLDAGYARAIGLASAGAETAKGTGGEATVSFAEDVSVTALGDEYGPQTVAILDLSDISARLIGSPLTAIIGRELFDNNRLEIDIKNETIRLMSRDNQPNGVFNTLTTENGIEVFDISVNGVAPVKAEFDLGNGSEVLIGADFAGALGLLSDDAQLETRSGGGVGGAVDRKIVYLDEMIVAGRKFQNVEAAVDRTDNAAEINLGVNILKNFLITADFQEDALWLAPN